MHPTAMLLPLGLLFGAAFAFWRRSQAPLPQRLRATAAGAAIGLLAAIVLGNLLARRLPSVSTSSEHLIQIESTAQFDELVENNPLVLADFYADWCGPCRMLKPTIHELADEFHPAVKVVAIDVDEHTVLAQRFDIRSIPNVQLFRDGRSVETWIGVQPPETYRSVLRMLAE